MTKNTIINSVMIKKILTTIDMILPYSHNTLRTIEMTMNTLMTSMIPRLKWSRVKIDNPINFIHYLT